MTENISTHLSGFSQQQSEMARLPTHSGGHGTPHQIPLQLNFFWNQMFTDKNKHSTFNQNNHTANDVVSPDLLMQD